MLYIDCYGNRSDTCDYMHKERVAYQIDKSTENVKYVRFSTAETCPIHKISKSGNITTIAWTYGAWADRATLTYDKDLNTAITEPVA